MRRLTVSFLIAVAIIAAQPGFSKVTPLQLFYISKKVFAEKQEAYVLIDQKTFNQAEAAIKRASAQMQLELKIYLIGSKMDVGNAFKEIKDSGVLVVFDSHLLNQSATRLYVMSKCKDKHISIITNSTEYGDSGALLTLFSTDAGETKIKLNLQKNEEQKNRFTEELIKSSGITDVLM